jgi:hypothetical protein
LAATQARQKSYADKRRKPIEFEVGDYVYLKGLTYERRETFWNKKEA